MRKDENYQRYQDKFKEFEFNNNNDKLTYKSEQSLEEFIIAENHKEEIKEHKNKSLLIKKSFSLIRFLIIIQIGIFDFIIIFILCIISLKSKIFKDLDREIMINLFEFLKYFIGATVLQLLGMLVLILKFAFKKSPLSNGEYLRKEVI